MSTSIHSVRTLSDVASPYPEPSAESLSVREVEVLQWLASGASNRDISRRLTIAESTVKRHVYNIFGKLHVHNRTQAALQARKLGVVPQPNFLQL